MCIHYWLCDAYKERSKWRKKERKINSFALYSVIMNALRIVQETIALYKATIVNDVYEKWSRLRMKAGGE